MSSMYRHQIDGFFSGMSQDLLFKSAHKDVGIGGGHVGAHACSMKCWSPNSKLFFVRIWLISSARSSLGGSGVQGFYASVNAFLVGISMRHQG